MEGDGYRWAYLFSEKEGFKYFSEVDEEGMEYSTDSHETCLQKMIKIEKPSGR
jgi:hypothetical protein